MVEQVVAVVTETTSPLLLSATQNAATADLATSAKAIAIVIDNAAEISSAFKGREGGLAVFQCRDAVEILSTVSPLWRGSCTHDWTQLIFFTDRDYCYDPAAVSRGGNYNNNKGNDIGIKTPVRMCSSSAPCGLCEGDCDRNSDCSGNLVCHQKNGAGYVPGCGVEQSRKYP